MSGREKWLPLACVLFCLAAAPCQARSKAVSVWVQQISTQVQSHKHYPLEANGRFGETKISFTLDRTGKLASSRIVTGSGTAALDRAALDMVKNAEPFPPAPTDATDLTFAVVMHFGADDLWSEKKMRGVMSGICRGC